MCGAREHGSGYANGLHSGTFGQHGRESARERVPERESARERVPERECQRHCARDTVSERESEDQHEKSWS